MKRAMDETDRRRTIQEQYNIQHDIIPESIEKEVVSIFDALYETEETKPDAVAEELSEYSTLDLDELDRLIQKLEKKMHEAARDLEFERATELRDRIRSMKERYVFEL